MSDLERVGTRLADETVDCTTFEANLCLFALIGNFSHNSSMSKPLPFGSPDSSKKFAPIDFGEKDSGAILSKSVTVLKR